MAKITRAKVALHEFLEKKALATHKMSDEVYHSNNNNNDINNNGKTNIN